MARKSPPALVRACRAGGAVVPEAGPAPGGAHVLSPPREDLDEREPGPQPTRAARRVRWSKSRRPSPSPPPRSRRRRLGGPPHLACRLHRRRAHQPRPRKLGRLPAGRVVPRARGRVHRQLGRERVVLAPSAQGGRRTPARHHPQAEDRHHRAGRGDRGPPSAAGADRPAGEPARRGRRTVVARRPSRRRRACGLRDAHSAQRDPHELRGGGGLDGPDAPQGDAVLGQSDPRRRTLHAHRAHFAHRRHLPGGGVQRWLL